MCPLPDFNGKDENAAGTDYGAIGMFRAVLGAIGVYPPFVKFAGAGASVPLLGFGNTLFKGIKEAVDTNGFIGIFMGGFTATAVGISAALVFAYPASLIFEPKDEKVENPHRRCIEKDRLETINLKSIKRRY